MARKGLAVATNEESTLLSIPYERYTLANGLRVVLSEDRAVPVVAVNLWYLVGSRNEPPGRTGFAHLFEHMMFQGSQHVPENQYFALVERAGGSLNGSTWFDRTNYYQTLPAHHLELALWLESDRMGWLLPAMTQARLDNQRDVVKNERRWRYDNQPYGDWDERLQALVFPPEHPYHHSVVGSMEDLDVATLEDVESFFRTYYRPNNAVLTVCGDFDPAQAKDAVEGYFGGIPAGDPTPPLPGNPEVAPTLGGGVRQEVEGDVPLPRVYCAARIPPCGSADFYAAEALVGVLASGKASRLYRSLVRERRLARDVVAFAFPLITGAAMLVLWATGYAGVKAEALERALHEELDGVDTVTGAEVERAVALAETQMVREIEGMGERADLLSMFEAFFGDPGRLNTELDRLRAVTPDRLRRFAAAFLAADNRATLTYVPRRPS
ncbi:MAG: insulinase family protein [Gemmatimonadetes bacterium]|nr:insulinase family protein [Gemmatimonadota bacterium]